MDLIHRSASMLSAQVSAVVFSHAYQCCASQMNFSIDSLSVDGRSIDIRMLRGKLHVQATLALYGGYLLPYYLHEETGWSLSVDDLKSQTQKV